MTPLRIAVVVHGRFHGFDLARELAVLGHQVTIFTNYPGWTRGQFDLQPARIQSFSLHGALVRVLGRLTSRRWREVVERLSHILFGRWAARALVGERWDVIHPFSGVAEELLQAPALAGVPKLLARGSAHIKVQHQLLLEEERRTGIRLDRPSPWMIARELREYQLADAIVVLSSFARDTFISQGVPAARLAVLPLGVDVQAFRPVPAVVEERCGRILAGQPLRLLYTGALSLRKGMWDLAHILRDLDPERFAVELIGPVGNDIAALLPELRRRATLTRKQPQHMLPQRYAQADLFVLPTIEDGFALVVTQALAGALPVLTTTNSSGPDVVREGKTGWVLPIRHPEAFVARLRWCDANRAELAAMVRRSYSNFRPRDWAGVAADFGQLCTDVSVRWSHAQRPYP